MADNKCFTSARFFARLIKTSLLQAFSLKASFALRLVFMVFNNLIMLVGWWAMFTRFDTINGWTFKDFMFMTGLTVSAFSLWPLFFRGAGIYMARLIEYGDLDTFILQPKNILFHISCSISDPSGFGDLIAGCLLIILSGLLTTSTVFLILFFFLVAAICFLSINFIVSSLPFYFKNMADISERLFYIFFNIAGYPGSIYTGYAKLLLCTLLPTGLISILPVQLLHQFSIGLFLYMLLFTLGLFSFSIFLFYKGLKRYESGNRFGVK